MFGAALIILLIFLLAFTGCGGGGGGGAQGGAGVDPIEVEVGAALDGFLKAVSIGSITQSLEYVDQRLQYRRANPLTVEGFNGFRDRLTTFLNGAASISLLIPDRGITPSGESSATVRGTLTCRYVDSAKQEQGIAEACEMVFEKIGRWRITSLSDRDYLSGLKFPPKP